MSGNALPTEYTPKNMRVVLLSWLVFAGFIGYLFGWKAAATQWLLANKLAARGIHTTGVVLDFQVGDQLNSATAAYSYAVAGVKYTGIAAFNPANHLQRGQPIQLLTMPDDPSQSGFDLAAMVEAGRKGVLLTFAFLCFGSFFILGPITRSWLRLKKTGALQST